MEERKTLVEQIREMVEKANENETCPAVFATPVIGHSVSTSEDDIQLFTAIADRIEREYIPLPLLEGEPLKVGDKVDGYTQEGAEVVAVMNSDMVVVRSTVKGGYGYHDEAYPLLLWSVDSLKRHRQEVLDADGVPIIVGDVVYFVDNAEAFDVLGVESDGDEPVHIGRKDGTSTDAWVSPGDLTHKQPDTLERIEADAFMDSITYCNKYGLIDSRCNAEEGDEAVRHCVDCGLSCETRMVKHLLQRQREVIERGQA